MVKSYSISSVAKTFSYRMKIFRTLLCLLHRGYCTVAVHYEQSLVSALFKVSVGHLFHDLEYGKSLGFWIQKSVRTLKVSASALSGVGSARKKFSWPYNKSFIKLLHWPSLFGQGDWRLVLYFFLCVFFNGPRFRLDPRTHKTIRSMFSHLDLTLGQWRISTAIC